MPVVNVVDRRTNKYDVRCDVVYEPAWHDNSITGATKFKKTEHFSCDKIYDTTIQNVLKKDFDEEVTLFLYDFGSKPLG